MKYNTRSNLEVHLRKHAGVKPFICEACGRSYISKWNMAKHKKKNCKKKATQTNDEKILGKRSSDPRFEFQE